MEHGPTITFANRNFSSSFQVIINKKKEYTAHWERNCVYFQINQLCELNRDFVVVESIVFFYEQTEANMQINHPDELKAWLTVVLDPL